MIVVVCIREHSCSGQSSVPIQFTCGWEGRGQAMEHTTSRCEDHLLDVQVESLHECVNLQLEEWKIVIKKDIQDMVMELNRHIWGLFQAELAVLREELQRVKKDREGEGVGDLMGLSSSNTVRRKCGRSRGRSRVRKVVSVVPPGVWQQTVSINAASSSCDYVGINHHNAGQAALAQMNKIDRGLDYAAQLCNRSAVADFPEACHNEFGYLLFTSTEQSPSKRVNGALLATAAEVAQHQSDPLMPRFVDLSALSCSTWNENGAETDDLSPGFVQEVLGRGKHEKRQEIIQCVKRESSYYEYALMRDRGEEIPCVVPGTPDPNDETISKRKWEALVSKWRAALRQLQKIRNEASDDSAEQ